MGPRNSVMSDDQTSFGHERRAVGSRSTRRAIGLPTRELSWLAQDAAEGRFAGDVFTSIGE